MSDVVRHSSLHNPDLAPVPLDRRTWGMWTIAALWVGMSVCIPTYNLAAGMIAKGMSWAQAALTVALGNLIVCIPMVLNAHAGTKYGIPFPVLLRASFGTVGANVPAVMRGLVACGWFGIQTWIGGMAIYTLHSVIFGFQPAGPGDMLPLLGISAGQLACFLLFWAVNVFFIVFGTESIKWLEDLAAPFLIAVGLALLWWGVSKAGGWHVIFSQETLAKVRGADAGEFQFWRVFVPSLTAMVGFWATLSLNIPDFSRFAKSQRDQVMGQFLGLPPTMTLFSFIGISVTCASVVIYGKAIWDPVELLGKFGSPFVVGFALFALTVATLTTNIAANIVSPANDFSNLAPSRISFRTGGLIAAGIGVIIMPWKLLSDLGAYIFTWLIGYGALLGGIAGVMLVDYYLVRRRELDVDALFDPRGEYSYGSGWNWRAFVALALGIAPNVPGFLHAASNGGIKAPAAFVQIYDFAWFLSLAIAAVAYFGLMRMAPPASAGSAGERA